MKSKNKKLWEAIGFVCSFKKGFYLFNFNEEMALDDASYTKTLKKLVKSRVCWIDYF
jgi:hypothetical protein